MHDSRACQVARSIRPEDWEGSEALREPCANGGSAAAMAARIEGLRIRLTSLTPAGGGSVGSGASDGVSVSLGDLLRMPVEVRASLLPFGQAHGASLLTQPHAARAVLTAASEACRLKSEVLALCLAMCAILPGWGRQCSSQLLCPQSMYHAHVSSKS